MSREVKFRESTATVGPLTVRQIMRIAQMVDKVRQHLGMTREQMPEMNVEDITAFSQWAFTQLIGEIDLEQEVAELPETLKLVFREIGKICDMSDDEMADLTPDEFYTLVFAIWEENSSGPFGQWVRTKLTAITDAYRTQVMGILDGAALRFRRELTKDLLAGGTDDGGTTESSFPSSESSSGTTNTSEMSSQQAESSNSSQASDISSEFEQAQSEGLPAMQMESPPEAES